METVDTFKASVGGVEREILVREPKAEEIKESAKVRSKAFFKAIQDGLMFSKDTMELIRKTALTPEKSKEMTDLYKELAEKEEILTKKRNLKLGGPDNSDENTMFRVAMRCLDIRNKLTDLNTPFAEAQQNSVEGMAENERLNYLLYATTVYKDSGERVFSSYEDFDKSTVRTSQNEEKYIIATRAMVIYQMKLLNDFQKGIDSNPENAFFKRFKFINEKGRFINKDGKLVNSAGEFLDEDGNLKDEQKPVIEKPAPFLDNDGNPIEDEEYKAELAKYEASIAGGLKEVSSAGS